MKNVEKGPCKAPFQKAFLCYISANARLIPSWAKPPLGVECGPRVVEVRRKVAHRSSKGCRELGFPWFLIVFLRFAKISSFFRSSYTVGNSKSFLGISNTFLGISKKVLGHSKKILEKIEKF